MRDSATLGCGILHNRHLVSQLSQQADCAGDKIVNVQRPGHEGIDGPALSRGEWFDGGKLVHKEPVPLVSGDTSGTRVRLSDVAFLLQDRHVVANRGRGHTKLMPFHKRFGADRFPACHIVRDDGTQHLHLPVVEHGSPPHWHSKRASASVEHPRNTFRRCSLGPCARRLSARGNP